MRRPNVQRRRHGKNTAAEQGLRKDLGSPGSVSSTGNGLAAEADATAGSTAGERVFVDFAGHTMEVIDGAAGEARRAEIFVGVLGASSYTFAEAG